MKVEANSNCYTMQIVWDDKERSVNKWRVKRNRGFFLDGYRITHLSGFNIYLNVPTVLFVKPHIVQQ